MTVNETLLKRIRSRGEKQTPYGYGILTADRWVRTLEECAGHQACNKYAHTKAISFDDIKRRAAKTLTYSNPDMQAEAAAHGDDFEFASGNLKRVVEHWTREAVDRRELDIPKNSLIVFKHVLSTPRKDRDGDVLRSEGLEPDPKMLLLWQHVHTLPIGKMLAVVEHSAKRLSMVSCIVDMNDLCHDAAVMVDSDMARFSHGFRALEFEELKVESGEQPGFDVKRAEVMEESVVSVPSLVDAEVEEVMLSLIEGGKLTSPLMKATGKNIRKAMPLLMGSDSGYGKHYDAAFSLTKQTKDELYNAIARSAIDAEGTPAPGKGCACGNGASKETDAATGRQPGEAKNAKPAQVKLVRVPQNKHFGIDKEELEAAKLEYEWCSRFIGVPVKELVVVASSVPAIRKGSWLTGEKVALGGATLHDTRNLTRDGKEIPPLHDIVQLNSKQSGNFMVEGIRFYILESGKRIAIKHWESWNGGLNVLTYSADDAAGEVVDKAWDWAIENNFLKGEAFKLAGGFLTRGDTGMDDVFLTEVNDKPIRKTIELINRKGKAMNNRGMVYMGPPGTGKTLSGRAMMNEAKSTFIWVSARDFWRMGAVRGLCSAFDMAAELAPAVVFVEDVDNWLGTREVDILKTEMDGIEKSKGVTTILTTNYPERFPDALIDRPGRFDDVLRFSLPDEKTRVRMLQKWVPDANEMEIKTIAEKTEGFSGAHLYHLTDYAKSMSEDDETPISSALEKALDKINSQRELINESQLSGSNYQPRKGMVPAEMGLPLPPFQVKSTKGDGMSECPKCGGKMKDGECSKCGYKEGKDAPTEDTISKAYEGQLKDVAEDLDAVIKMSDVPRPAKTLVRAAAGGIKEVLSGVADEQPPAAAETEEATAKQLMAQFLVAAAPAERAAMLEALETFNAIDEADQKAAEFRQLQQAAN